MTSEPIFDLLVIGAGPGGYVCAIRAAQLGLQVGIIEKNKRLGGTCLNVGCIPSKALLHSTEVYHQIKTDAQTHGVACENVSLDLATMMNRKDKVVSQLGKGVQSLVSKKGVKIFEGSAELLGNRKVQVSNGSERFELEAKEIVLATGSKPIELPNLPFDGKKIISSDQAIALDKIPERLVVVGAGAIGLELGCVWSRLGSEVTILEFLPEICPQLDPEIAKTTRKIFEKQGITFQLSTKVETAKVTQKEVSLTITQDKQTSKISADCVLVAVGREPFAKGLGIEKLNLAMDEKGRVQVGQDFSTNLDGIRAIGDLIHGPMLAHKAEEDGVACAEILAGQAGHVDYCLVPGVIYSDPEVANIGMSESQAKKEGILTKCGAFPMVGNGRAIATSSTDGVVKLVADAKTDRILGAQIVAHSASELIASVVAHMEYGGSAEDLARTIHAHPTLSESIKEAALSVDGRGLHSL